MFDFLGFMEACACRQVYDARTFFAREFARLSSILLVIRFAVSKGWQWQRTFSLLRDANA
jgi:hypothetical protein